MYTALPISCGKIYFLSAKNIREQFYKQKTGRETLKMNLIKRVYQNKILYLSLDLAVRTEMCKAEIMFNRQWCYQKSYFE